MTEVVIYARVSTRVQEYDRQEEELRNIQAITSTSINTLRGLKEFL